MHRYCSFFDINEEGNRHLRAKLERERIKVYFDLKNNRFVCHEVVHQRHRKNQPQLIDELYRSAKSEYDTQNERIIYLTKEERQERLAGIKDILKRSVKRNIKYDENLKRMIDDSLLSLYVEDKGKEELHAEYAKKKLFMRKCGLNRKKLNYWFTITFDPTKFATAEEWLDTLFCWFKNNAYRYEVKIMGGIEFGDENGRIHFHGVGHFPDGFFGDGLHKVHRYSKKDRRWKTMLEYDELREKFGINEFESLRGMDERDFMKVLHYISDYATKQGGRMYYSRGLPSCAYQYVSADELIFEFEDGQMKYFLKSSFQLGKDSIDAMLRNGHFQRLGVEEAEELPFKEAY